MTNIDASKIVTREERELSQKAKEREAAMEARSKKYRELTDPLLLEIIRKRFKDDSDFEEVARIADMIHKEIPVPEP